MTAIPQFWRKASSFHAETERFYDRGMPRGESTGWASVDELYTVATGQWTVVTGSPGSGKSEWLDALMINLAEKSDWRFALYSPENRPYELHVSKLLEKRIRKPFGAGPTDRMTVAERDAAEAWLDRHFLWLPIDGASPDELLNGCGRAIIAQGPSPRWGIVIDPWNYLEHEHGRESEAQYLSRVLSNIANFSREFTPSLAGNCGFHIWVVAHPSKLERGKDGARPIPTPYDINGGAMWFNKADNILCVHRDKMDCGQDVYVHTQKIKFKHIGRLGVARLLYDKVTGRYSDPVGQAYGEYRSRRTREPGEDD